MPTTGRPVWESIGAKTTGQTIPSTTGGCPVGGRSPAGGLLEADPQEGALSEADPQQGAPLTVRRVSGAPCSRTGSQLGTAPTQLVDRAHRVAQLVQPRVGVLTDQAHAPGERVRAGAGHPGR